LERRYRFALWIFILLGCWVGMQAQAAPGAPSSSHLDNTAKITLGQSAAPLYGPWKFTVGDSPIDPVTHQPLWAEPDFDDSRWEEVNLTPRDDAKDPTFGFSSYAPGWTAKGHPGCWGYAWYRIRVRLNAQPGEKMAVAGPADFDDGYELFANGTRLGSFGDFSGSTPRYYFSQPMTFPLPMRSISDSVTTKLLPGAANDGSFTAVLAFRFWMSRSTLDQAEDTGGIHVAPMLGEAGTVSVIYQSQRLEAVRFFSLYIIEVITFLLLGLGAFCLIFCDRSDRVYLWIGAVFLLIAIYSAVQIVASFTQLTDALYSIAIIDILQFPFGYACWVMVWWVWFGLRRPSWFPRASTTLAVVLAVVLVVRDLWDDLFHIAIPHPVSISLSAVSLVIRIAFPGILLWIVAQGVRSKGIEGWLALPPVLLFGVQRFTGVINALYIRLNWRLFGVFIGLWNIADLLLAMVLALLLLRRLVHSLRRQRRMALDVKQAQEVQQVILPLAQMKLPGFAIQCEYRPALEVGGDFFQIIPHPTDGSVLIVAGDVTGKGLKAGMLVALLVGAIRTAAESNPDPESLLGALNRRLLGRGDAHATCLALRIAKDGAVTLANSGHLPPYLNGLPLAMEGALPLGMVEGAEFSVMRFKLAEGDRMLQLSDGIAEATDADGHLFGFERVLDLLRTNPTAAEVAAAAQKFGQSDDISVISVTRTAGMEEAER